MFFPSEGLKRQKPGKWSRRPLKARVHANSYTLVTHNGLPETQCCSRHYLSKSCFSTSRPFLFLLPASVFCAHSLYFAACSPDSSSQDILISVPQTSALGISMKHEKSIRGRGPVSDAEGCGWWIGSWGRTLGVKWSCRWNATKKRKTKKEKQANAKQRVKDCRMTSWQHPKVPQAQSARSLCLDNDFPTTVASSLVNEVIAVSTVTLYLESSKDI